MTCPFEPPFVLTTCRHHQMQDGFSGNCGGCPGTLKSCHVFEAKLRLMVRTEGLSVSRAARNLSRNASIELITGNCPCYSFTIKLIKRTYQNNRGSSSTTNPTLNNLLMPFRGPIECTAQNNHCRHVFTCHRPGSP